MQPREPRVCPAGALAIGGFGRSRWRGGRGGACGENWASRSHGKRIQSLRAEHLFSCSIPSRDWLCSGRSIAEGDTIRSRGLFGGYPVRPEVDPASVCPFLRESHGRAVQIRWRDGRPTSPASIIRSLSAALHPSLIAERGGCSTRVIYEAWRFFLMLVLLEHHDSSIQSVMVRDCWPFDISGYDGFSSGVCNAGEARPLGTFFVGRSAALGRRFGTFASTCSWVLGSRSHGYSVVILKNNV